MMSAGGALKMSRIRDAALALLERICLFSQCTFYRFSPSQANVPFELITPLFSGLLSGGE
jgi:hypothetical protein